MKKLLIIALLFWGCDIFEDDDTHTHDGICVRRIDTYSGTYGDTNKYQCYTEWNEKVCMSVMAQGEYAEYDNNNWGVDVDWFTSLSCEEFCEQPYLEYDVWHDVLECTIITTPFGDS